MTGPLFDPSKMNARRSREKSAAAVPERDRPLTVSALASLVDGALRAGVPGKVRVLGEVSGLRERTHWYFDLKDPAASIGCVMFASAAARVRFKPEDGREVVAGGRVEFYAKQGRVSLIVDSIEPVGAGALDLALRKMIEELRGLGYLDPGRKRPLPVFPRRIGVVTSRSAAALQDVLVTMKKRCPSVGVLLADVRVQGDGAAEEVARAVNALNLHHAALGIDAILVTRGGGSKEDLWAFNERVVADAIYRSRVPVVAAIGHETDVTVAELVADERCATPTQAAVRLTPDIVALGRQVDSTGRRLASAMSAVAADGRYATVNAARSLAGAVAEHRHVAALAVERAAARLERQRPRAVLARMRERLDGAAARLRAGAKGTLLAADLGEASARLRRAAGLIAPALASRLDADERQLHAVSPLRVLERGYSVTTGRDGRLVRTTADARPGDRLTTRVSDGTVASRVEDAGAPAPVRAIGGSRASRRPARGSAPGPGLFGSDPS